jgi:hypothetical protein
VDDVYQWSINLTQNVQVGRWEEGEPVQASIPNTTGINKDTLLHHKSGTR